MVKKIKAKIHDLPVKVVKPHTFYDVWVFYAKFGVPGWEYYSGDFETYEKAINVAEELEKAVIVETTLPEVKY